MTELPPLDGLSHKEKDALIRGLWGQLQTLQAEVEKRQQKRDKKTARNSVCRLLKDLSRISTAVKPPRPALGIATVVVP